MIFETQEQLDAALAKWQRILRLQDWDIKAQLKSYDDMPGDQEACVVIYSNLHAAWIRIVVDEKGHSSRLTLWPMDHEIGLVHELLHVHMKGFEPDREKEPDRWTALESTVETLANQIVKLDRAQFADGGSALGASSNAGA